MTGKHYPFETLPRPMDVVWSLFPYEEKPGVPAPSPHPALVFQTHEYLDGLYSVRVAYGTSKVGRAERSQHFVVSNYNALLFAGLNRETFFDLGRAAWLPWTDAFFKTPDVSKYPTPVIGRIVGDEIAALRYILTQRTAAGLTVP